jgi:hypothetical protein
MKTCDSANVAMLQTPRCHVAAHLNESTRRPFRRQAFSSQRRASARPTQARRIDLTGRVCEFNAEPQVAQVAGKGKPLTATTIRAHVAICAILISCLRERKTWRLQAVSGCSLSPLLIFCKTAINLLLRPAAAYSSRTTERGVELTIVVGPSHHSRRSKRNEQGNRRCGFLT